MRSLQFVSSVCGLAAILVTMDSVQAQAPVQEFCEVLRAFYDEENDVKVLPPDSEDDGYIQIYGIYQIDFRIFAPVASDYHWAIYAGNLQVKSGNIHVQENSYETFSVSDTYRDGAPWPGRNLKLVVDGPNGRLVTHRFLDGSDEFLEMNFIELWPTDPTLMTWSASVKVEWAFSSIMGKETPLFVRLRPLTELGTETGTWTTLYQRSVGSYFFQKNLTISAPVFRVNHPVVQQITGWATCLRFKANYFSRDANGQWVEGEERWLPGSTQVEKF